MLTRFMFLQRWLSQQEWFMHRTQYLYEAKLLYRTLPKHSQNVALFWMAVGSFLFPLVSPVVSLRDDNLEPANCKCAKAGGK